MCSTLDLFRILFLCFHSRKSTTIYERNATMTLLVLNINWGGKNNNLINDISHHEVSMHLEKLSAPYLLFLYIEVQQQVTTIANNDKDMYANKICHVSFTHIMTTNNQSKDPYRLITNYFKWTWPWDVQVTSNVVLMMAIVQIY